MIDTNIIIYSLKNHSTVNDNFLKYLNTPKSISAFTYGKLVYGAKKAKHEKKNLAVTRRSADLFPIINITKSIMETFGELKYLLEKKGTIIDDMDLLIASTALTHNMTLVTNNEKHFKNIDGLQMENWAK